MFTSSKCVSALFLATLAWGQSQVEWPTQSVGAPGTTGLAVVNVTPVGAGYTAEVVATVTERCVPPTTTVGTPTTPTTPITAPVTGRPALVCSTVSGNPRLLRRQGSQLTRGGDTLLTVDRDVLQQGTSLGTNMEALELLEENMSSPTMPTLRTIARVESPELSCVVSTNGQSVLTHRGIQSYVFNEPLNVLFVETIHSKTTFSAPTAVGATGLCGRTVNGTEYPILHEETRTLVRIRGFNPTRPVGF
jgi:hypothetical protein